jgi:hypothetical protein
MLSRYEVPVAYSMIMLAHQSSKFEPQPFQEFMCYWTAFNNIYTTLAEQKGHGARLRKHKDGSIRTRPNGSLQIPEVEKIITEREEIASAFDEFSNTLKHGLITHPNTEFFINRIPKWHGHRIKTDATGQRLNGVMNLRYTVSAQHSVWSPIDIQAYERFMQGKHDQGDTDLLAKQILFMLYTVRNNTFHGGKRADDANDHEVVEKALPLLSMIVGHFIHTAS